MTSAQRRRSPSRRTTRATALAAAAVVVVAGAGAASAATAPSSKAVDLGDRPVVIATVGSPGDAATAAGAAARVDAPVLYTTSTSLSPSTRTFLKGYKASSVVVVGGTAAISQGVAREVDGLSGTLHRVAGADKYETAAAVAAFMARVPAAAPAKDGASAYQLWLSAGHRGTTADFLASLKGTQGLQGLAGVDGKDGEQGEVGAQGPQGLAGADGEDGAAGLDGQDGAAGAQGEVGPRGLTGAQGPQGLRGEPGEVGPQGLAGPTGDAGPAGPAGPAGVQGEKGEAGATGTTGPQGPAGVQGEKGETGVAGPAGATGPAGPAGPSGGLTGYRVVTQTFSGLSSGTFTGSVSCGPGEQALSGGWDVDPAMDGNGSTFTYPEEARVLPDGRTFRFVSAVDTTDGAVLLSVVCVGSSGSV